jgi:hypothetical protein
VCPDKPENHDSRSPARQIASKPRLRDPRPPKRPATVTSRAILRRGRPPTFNFSGGTSPRPGVHCVEALTTGKTLEGWWFDRTQEYLARRRGESFGYYQFATRETFELTPLPCWKHLSPEKRQQFAAALVAEIEGEAADRRERTGAQALGPAAILAQSPESRPLKTKRSPAPAVHAASRAVRRELRNAYFLFVAAYRNTAEKLRAGQRDPPFPTGCFPPPLPFVGG